MRHKYKYSILFPIDTPKDELSDFTPLVIDLPIGRYETNGLKYATSEEFSQQFFNTSPKSCTMQPQSNFDKLKPTFKQETGKNWNDDLQAYIMYYQAKMIEMLANGYYTAHKLQSGHR